MATPLQERVTYHTLNRGAQVRADKLLGWARKYVPEHELCLIHRDTWFSLIFFSLDLAPATL